MNNRNSNNNMIEKLGVTKPAPKTPSPPSTPPPFQNNTNSIGGNNAAEEYLDNYDDDLSKSNTPTTAPRFSSSSNNKDNLATDIRQGDGLAFVLPIPPSQQRHLIPLTRVPSLTSSTRSVTSNAYSFQDTCKIENLEGLVIHEEEETNNDESSEHNEEITIFTTEENNNKYPNRQHEDEEDAISTGYVSGASVSASQNTAPTNRSYNETNNYNNNNSSFKTIQSAKPIANNPSAFGGNPVNTNQRSNSSSHNYHKKSSITHNTTMNHPRDDYYSSPQIAAQMASNAAKKAVSDLKIHVDKRLKEIKEQNRRDFDKVFATLQHDSLKRSALDGRLHQQLLLQSETMVAMEIKLLRLEAKVERREREAATQRQQRGGAVARQHSSPFGILNTSLTGSSGLGGGGRRTNTIDEEDDLGKMEIRVTTRNTLTNNIQNNPHYRGRGVNINSGGLIGSTNRAHPPTTAVVSSGASLASAVTATSFLDGVEEHVDNDTIDNPDLRSEDGDVEDEGDGGGENVDDGSTSTPTQGSSRHFTNLESILMNPIYSSNVGEQGISTRAIRGDGDGNSSLATSVTSATLTSTVVTATTRGGDSINPRSMSQLTNAEDDDEEGVQDYGVVTHSPRGRGERLVDTALLGLTPLAEVGSPRSRSQSPLTVQSGTAASLATGSLELQSVASTSHGASILSTAAIAPARSFRARRDAAARMGFQFGSGDNNRPLANRIVSFTTNEIFNTTAPTPEINEPPDSITMPDELDNLSDVADVFADRARSWREEYETRLDAISKRFGTE